MYVCRHVCGCVWTTCEVYDLCCPLAPWSFSPGCSIGSLIHWNLSYWRSMYTKIHVQHTWHCMLPFICFPFKNSAERTSHQKNAACVAFLKNCRSVLQHLLLMPEFLSISGTIKSYTYVFMHLGVHQPLGCDTLVYIHTAWEFSDGFQSSLFSKIRQEQMHHDYLNWVEQTKRHSELLGKARFFFSVSRSNFS